MVRISTFCRGVEEVLGCGVGDDPLGQLGDRVSQLQAAGIYLKANLGLVSCQ